VNKSCPSRKLHREQNHEDMCHEYGKSAAMYLYAATCMELKRTPFFNAVRQSCKVVFGEVKGDVAKHEA